MEIDQKLDCPIVDSAPTANTQVVEVAFKAGRVGIFLIKPGLQINSEDYVIVEADKGYDLGKAIQIGSFYRGEDFQEELKHIIRIASPEDMDIYYKNRETEDKAIRTCKEKILKHSLNMNLVDSEYQWDHNKLTFYFTSDNRVDFRALVRDLASKFKTRIELRQIGVRDAARHVGGYGACGCQLCCTTFLKKFENITTQYVKDQLIQTSSSRLTGICGRLKCCLSFERDFYMEELSQYPLVNDKINTPDGSGYVEKVDIFNKIVYVRLKSNDIEKYAYQELQKLNVN